MPQIFKSEYALVVIAALGATLLAGCSSGQDAPSSASERPAASSSAASSAGGATAPDDVRILTVTPIEGHLRSGEQHGISVQTKSCVSGRVEFDVEETATEVILAATADLPENGPECLDIEQVPLEAPLGDRKVIDSSTGRAVEIGSPDE